MSKRIIVESEEKNGRYHLSVLFPDEEDVMSLNEVRSLLAGALAMTIRGDKNEARAMREVIEYLESEFTNPDSFNDVSVGIKH